MTFLPISTGLLSSAAVVALLTFSRLSVQHPPEPKVLEVREVELSFEEPPPPPPPPPAAGSGSDEAGPPPPPVALTALSDVPDPTMVALPSVDLPIPVDLPVDAFQLQSRPGLASSGTYGPPGSGIGSPGGTGTGNGIGPGRPGGPSVPGRTSFRVTDLDGSPRLLHHPSVTFPARLAAAKVKAGTVVLEVELSEVGRVSVRRVVSATHPELVAPARYLAQGSRYTPPKMNGVAVKAVMRWPITITQ
ncbi:MAG: TonB protein C-terminal [Verrucomicrobia bacterium]|nr:MAG: TonB protein C-terminal [Verrucomicrobiota bacterium]